MIWRLDLASHGVCSDPDVWLQLQLKRANLYVERLTATLGLRSSVQAAPGRQMSFNETTAHCAPTGKRTSVRHIRVIRTERHKGVR